MHRWIALGCALTFGLLVARVLSISTSDPEHALLFGRIYGACLYLCAIALTLTLERFSGRSRLSAGTRAIVIGAALMSTSIAFTDLLTGGPTGEGRALFGEVYHSSTPGPFAWANGLFLAGLLIQFGWLIRSQLAEQPRLRRVLTVGMLIFGASAATNLVKLLIDSRVPALLELSFPVIQAFFTQVAVIQNKEIRDGLESAIAE